MDFIHFKWNPLNALLYWARMQKVEKPYLILHVIVPTCTTNYCTSNDGADVYGRNLRGKLSCIKGGVTNDVQNVFSIDCRSEKLDSEQRTASETLKSSDPILVSGVGNLETFCWVCSISGKKKNRVRVVDSYVFITDISWMVGDVI